MVRIRLRRVGAKKQASYRIVVINRQAATKGRPIETIGHFNPRTEPETVLVKADRALYWLGVGAQPSDAVLRLLKKEGIMDQFASIKAGEVADSSEEEALKAEETLPVDDEHINEEEE